LAAGKVAGVDKWELAAPKAKEFLKALAPVQLTGRRTLLILGEIAPETVLAARNIADLEIASVTSVGVSSILNADRILGDKASLEALFARVAGKPAAKSVKTSVKPKEETPTDADKEQE
jgi:hypothetical protein